MIPTINDSLKRSSKALGYKDTKSSFHLNIYNIALKNTLEILNKNDMFH